MATQEDVRCIALALPETSEGESGFGFGVMNRGKSKGFAWVWKERLHPKKPRVPNPEVIALRVADESEKAMLLAADAEKFFTRLTAIDYSTKKIVCHVKFIAVRY